MTKWRLHNVSPLVPFFQGVHDRKPNSRNFWPGTKKQSFCHSIKHQQETYVGFFTTSCTFEKNFNFHEKNCHKIFYKKKLCNILKNPYFAGESNFEYIFKISDRSVKIFSSYQSYQNLFGKKKNFDFLKIL